MTHHLIVLDTAEVDLDEIHLYVELHDSPERADALLDGLEKAILALADLPERGHVPPELERIGIHEYREIHFKPYRVIYTIHGASVIVHCILDGRRDMQAILQQRLLR